MQATEEVGHEAEKLLQDQVRALSPLMRLKRAANQGEKVNICPYGCQTKDLDDTGYCKHVVGISSDKVTYEPMVRGRGGRRVIRVVREKILTGEMDEDGQEDFVWGEPQLPLVLPGDRLAQIATSYRVYRQHPSDPPEAAAAPAPRDKRDALIEDMAKELKGLRNRVEELETTPKAKK